ncbi:DNA repair protein RecO [Flavobacteriaceae bacterium]|nr:DNA repair protein RecO [Flavobacteriaceae bacterium]
MLIQTKAIVLHTLKYNDTSLIAHCYTEALGKQSFLLKGILSARKGGIRKAYFLPMTQLEIQFQHKNKGGLNFLKEVKILHPYQQLYTDIKKNALVLFLSEIIYKSLKEEETNPLLYEFLENAFLWLDSNEDIANFHLLFLLKLSQFLGFYPHLDQENGAYFNLESGCFTSSTPLEKHIKGNSAQLLKELLGMNFAGIKRPKINQHTRRELLEAMVNYFELHLLGFSKPKSLSILHDVFD